MFRTAAVSFAAVAVLLSYLALGPKPKAGGSASARIAPIVWALPEQASPAPTAPAAGSPGQKPVVTFGLQPAGPDKPDGRGYFDFGATTGAKLTDHVAVTNFAYQAVTVAVHATDAANTADGDFALEPPDRKVVGLGAWLSFQSATSSVTVPPRQTVIVPFELSVPKDATPGDHAGGIIATLESSVLNQSGERIRLLQSVGTRIFVRVSGTLHPALTVGHLTVTYRGTENPFGSGSVVVAYTVRNTGNTALGGAQTVSISGIFGSHTRSQGVPKIQLLLPGYSVREKVVFPEVFPQLRMKAHVSISPLVIPGSVNPPSGPFRGAVAFWAVPWVLVVMIVGLLVLLGGATAWLRSRRRRPKPPSEVAPGLSGPNGTPGASIAKSDITAGTGSR